jgi:hypothetical protein
MTQGTNLTQRHKGTNPVVGRGSGLDERYSQSEIAFRRLVGSDAWQLPNREWRNPRLGGFQVLRSIGPRKHHFALQCR